MAQILKLLTEATHASAKVRTGLNTGSRTRQSDDVNGRYDAHDKLRKMQGDSAGANVGVHMCLVPVPPIWAEAVK